MSAVSGAVGAVIGVGVTGFTSQLRQMRATPDWLLALFTTPLMTVAFVALVDHADRRDLTAYAVLAPALIALWQMALQTAGELVTTERENGSLEALLATPGSFAALLAGRIAAVTAVSLLAFVEAWGVGWAMTGSPLAVAHPVVFAATVLVSAAAMTATAGIMASVFVLARSARIFQNALSYPFYVLGGVVLPVALLPEPFAWLSRLVFLSWTSDLLRDAVAPAPVDAVVPRLLVIAALGAAAAGLSHHLLVRTVGRLRVTGRLSHA